MKIIFGEAIADKEQAKILFSQQYMKYNRVNVLKVRLLVLTKDRLLIFNLDKEVTKPSYDITFDKVKAISRIKPLDTNAQEDQFILHVHGQIDHVIFFTNQVHFEQTYLAIKYAYWKNQKFNVQVFQQSQDVVKRSKYTTKRMINNQKQEHPLPN